MKSVILGHAAAKQFDSLPVDVREAIADGLERYAVSQIGDVKKLLGLDGLRLRIGRYRVIFEEDANALIVLSVGKRETTSYR